ncbi:MAG: ATP-binding protein, partial [bacterium]|nr:ATP-binding protein [bacterium]
LEFKSTIRWNLKTNKAGKEIEIAWLKTVAAYLNSEGGTLLLGVRDDGEVLGLEADNFQNEDRLLLHVNNLIKQHVGLEFVQFIEVKLYHIEDRRILGIRCVPSKAAVFLKQNKDEQFFIRTGPSTLRLSGSEMLKYLAQQTGK